jgi:predicted DsbA family dithiol-disulfide isomerase
MDGLKNIAIELGVNESDLNTCIDEWRYTKAVEDMMNQWAKLFGVSGTPGNVIVDRETGKYEVVPGAYPADTFIEKINAMKWE